MTFSIVARDEATGAFGVAVASKALCVGAHVPWGADRLGGAVATQAWHDLRYGWEALEELRAGRSAADTVARLTIGDPQAPFRQLGIVDATGHAASYTGSGCMPWAGGMCGAGFAVQGNILAGAVVVEAMAAAYGSGRDLAFAPRLLQALLAGDGAGGDRRGRQSAALRIWRGPQAGDPGACCVVDLRVDDAEEPAHRLNELLPALWLESGTADESTAFPLDMQMLDRLARALGAEAGTRSPDELAADLASAAGAANLEHRLIPGKVDRVVLDVLEHGRSAVLEQVAQALPRLGWPA